MADGYFRLATRDRREALLIAAQHLDRPADLVEKDVYVVWALNALERAPWASDVIFKGGTSLSKAHRVIDRFSEDVDLTYDARALAPDVVGDGGAIADQGLAHEVAAWKNLFFREPGVDFPAAVRGSLRLVPEGLSRAALAEDYA